MYALPELYAENQDNALKIKIERKDYLGCRCYPVDRIVIFRELFDLTRDKQAAHFGCKLLPALITVYCNSA